MRAILSLVVVALTLLISAPAVANDAANDASNNVACADQLTSASTEQVNCSSDYDCGYNNICEYGQCRPAQCWSDSQCFSWEECDRGRCQRDPLAHSCIKDTECIGARICRNGYCKKW